MEPEAEARVDVLLAAYNAAATLERAVRSIVAQTFTDWRLLLVDDGSDDGTPALIDRLSASEPRITPVRLPRNVGLAAALNAGLDLAHAPLVARMDADDEAAPTRLATQVAFMDAHPEVDVVGGAVELIDRRGSSQGVYAPPSDHAQLYARRYRSCPFIHPTVVFRPGAVRRCGGYDVGAHRCEDFDLWLRMAAAGARFANVDDVVLRYSMPARISLRQSVSTARMLWRAGARDRNPAAAWHGLRFLAANAVLHRMMRANTERRASC